jgi:cytochrome c
VNKQGLLNILLAGLLAALLGLFLLLHTDSKHKNNYLLRGMDTSPAIQDFQPNDTFANGQTLQVPPAGTVPRGDYQPYHFAPGVEGALQAEKELKSPLAAGDPEVLERGKRIFERDCLPCHGAYGRGDGPVSMTKRDGGYPGVANLLAAHAKGVKDGYIYAYISRGGAIMPSYGAQVTPADRWKVVAYVRELQKTQPENAPAEAPSAGSGQAPSASSGQAPSAGSGQAEAAPTAAAAAAAPAPAAAAPAAAKPAGDPWAAAQALMKKNDCLGCHSVDKKVVGPAYKDVAKRYAGKDVVATLVKKVKAGGAGNWGEIPMSAHPNVPDADIEVMVRGVLSLAGGHARAHTSLKQVMALVHSGAPVKCPVAGVGAGPQFLALADRDSLARVDRAEPNVNVEARP